MIIFFTEAQHGKSGDLKANTSYNTRILSGVTYKNHYTILKLINDINCIQFAKNCTKWTNCSQVGACSAGQGLFLVSHLSTLSTQIKFYMLQCHYTHL